MSHALGTLALAAAGLIGLAMLAACVAAGRSDEAMEGRAIR